MLNLKYIIENINLVEKSIKSKNVDFNLDVILDLDNKRKSLIHTFFNTIHKILYIFFC